MSNERKPLRLFRWGDGREMTGYRAFTLIFSKVLGLDCYIIHYKDGSYIPPHTDKLKEGVMYRLGIVFWNTGGGGKFIGDTIFNWKDRIIFFKPSVTEHSVTQKVGGSRWVLSFGKVL